MNIWGMIQQSLEEINDRNTFVLEFNRFAKRMFSEGVTDVLYQSSVSGGMSGPKALKIKVLAEGELTVKDLKSLDVVTDFLNDMRVARVLLTLGFSYVDIYASSGSAAIRGDLLKFAGMRKYENPNVESPSNSSGDGSDGCSTAIAFLAVLFLIGVLIFSISVAGL